MKREILFRGKRIDNGGWVEGDIIQGKISDKKSIWPIESGNTMDIVAVIPETIGQFTGLLDKNESKTFEDDLIKYGPLTFKVIFYNNAFKLQHVKTKVIIDLPPSDHFFEVIGNIHDTDKTDPEDLF